MRKKAPMPLDTLRKKQASQANDIAALKAGVLELQQRLAKVEVAVGKGEEPPTPVAREETQSDEQQAEQSADQQPETE